MKPILLSFFSCMIMLSFTQDPFSAEYRPVSSREDLAESNDISDEKYQVSFPNILRITDSVKALLRYPDHSIRVIPLERVDNAYAYRRDGMEYIGIDTIFLSDMWKKSGTYWAVWGILAHEVGHHYYRHLTYPMEETLQEAGADYIGGYVLGRLGAPENCIPRIMEVLATPFGSSTHPPRRDRIHAMRKGWQAGRDFPGS